MGSSDFEWYFWHMVHRRTCRQNTHTHKRITKFFSLVLLVIGIARSRFSELEPVLALGLLMLPSTVMGSGPVLGVFASPCASADTQIVPTDGFYGLGIWLVE